MVITQCEESCMGMGGNPGNSTVLGTKAAVLSWRWGDYVYWETVGMGRELQTRTLVKEIV